jgi:putative tricarboxylic transport membrane protein
MRSKKRISVADEFERLVFEGGYQPGAGTDDNAFAARFGISTALVREACRLVQRAGLVHIVPNRSSFAGAPSLIGVVNMFDLCARWSRLVKQSAAAATVGVAFACLLTCITPPRARAETAQWSPQNNVEFIVPTAAGSTMDVLARTIEDIWHNNNLVNTSITVQDKPGSGGAIAWAYVSRKTGNGHYIAISGPTLLANDILQIGNLSYKDVTPIAQLFTEYTAFAVRADGPIKTGADLVAALRTPSPPSVGIAPGFGGSSHVAVLKLARAAGIEPRSLTVVPFKGANESVTALLGRHIDVSVATMSVIAPFLETGELRAIAIAAPKRLSGPQSVIPTWKELGFDVVEGNWRGIVGPKNLGEAEVAFWSSRLSQLVKTDAWIASLKRNFWDADFTTSADSKRFLDTQYEELRSTLATLHLAK